MRQHWNYKKKSFKKYGKTLKNVTVFSKLQSLNNSKESLFLKQRKYKCYGIITNLQTYFTNVIFFQSNQNKLCKNILCH